MSEPVQFTPEEKVLLSKVVRKRQPSFLWIVASMNERPLEPGQRDTLKNMLKDEMRESGSASPRGLELKDLIGKLG
jgi:hypothetical protein